jgi:digeranylgeranylglycerophospholipid reductase
MYDVIVIGAGPIGSHAAYLVASQGFRVLAVEEHETVGEPVHCTGIIGAEAFRRFNLPEDCIEAELHSAILRSPGGQVLHVEKTHAQAYVVDRARLDRRLAERAFGVGASFWLGTRAEDLQPGDDHVAVSVNSHGERQWVKARLCVLATGVDRALVSRLGFRPRPRYLHAAQAWVEVDRVAEVELFFGRTVAPGSFGWAVPGGSGRTRIGVSCADGALAHLRALVDSEPLRERVAGELRPTARPIPMGQVARTSGRRVLLVGDAAAQTKSTTGGGVYYGLLCAEHLAETIGEALRAGDCSDRMLARYDARWHRALGREIRMGELLRRVAGRLNDRQIDGLFRAAGRNGLIAHIEQQSHFDWHSDVIVALLRQTLPGAEFLGRALLRAA